jgi:thymidylate kinase
MRFPERFRMIDANRPLSVIQGEIAAHLEELCRA